MVTQFLLSWYVLTFSWLVGSHLVLDRVAGGEADDAPGSAAYLQYQLSTAATEKRLSSTTTEVLTSERHGR